VSWPAPEVFVSEKGYQMPPVLCDASSFQLCKRGEGLSRLSKEKEHQENVELAGRSHRHTHKRVWHIIQGCHNAQNEETGLTLFGPLISLAAQFSR
jgi:hypothetical protein